MFTYVCVYVYKEKNKETGNKPKATWVLVHPAVASPLSEGDSLSTTTSGINNRKNHLKAKVYIDI